MSVARIPGWSFRLEQAESSRLAWAFGISLAFHLVVFGGYYTGQKYHLWENLHWPAWLRPLQTLVEVFKKKENLQAQLPQVPPPEAPLMFVDVNPVQATPEPPKNAKFYSDKNSLAANPDPKLDSDIPQITGNQKEVPKTEDVPRQEFVPLQPAPPPKPLPPAKEAQEERKAKPAPLRATWRWPNRSPLRPRTRARPAQTPAHSGGGVGEAAEQSLARGEDEAGRGGEAPFGNSFAGRQSHPVRRV